MSSTSSSKPLSLPAARAYYVMEETEGEVAESFTVEQTWKYREFPSGLLPQTNQRI